MPLFRHSCRIITEPDDFQDAVTGIDLKVDFQRRQEQASRVEQFQCPWWALDFGEANVRTRVRGVLRDGWGSMCLGLGQGEAVWNGQQARSGSLTLLPPHDELDGRTSAGYSWLTLAVPPDVWNRCMLLAGRDVAPNELTVLHIPEKILTPIIHQIQNYSSELISASTSNDRIISAMNQTAGLVNEAFTIACEQGSRTEWTRGSFQNRARLARRAEEWMLDHLDEAVQVPDLCLALRVSRRELEYAFRTIFDVSPREHLAMLRLNAIRRAIIRREDKSISDIAYAHGVTHLSRFAASYLALFGEKPSETKRY